MNKRFPGETMESFRRRCVIMKSLAKIRRRGEVVWPSSQLGTFRRDGKMSGRKGGR